MYVVAISALSSTTSDLRQLATDLGTTLYELKLLLNAGLPAVVVLTVDAAVAADAARVIALHGHRCVSADRRTFTASADMTAVVDVDFGPEALLAGNGRGDRLRYEDVFSVLRATQRGQETGLREEKERKFRPGMALATGGLVLSKTTTQKVVTHTETREQVLYLFRHDGGTPWLLREHAARFAGLGADLAPTAIENFKTTLQKLRQRAPRALYDERLLGLRPIRGLSDVAATDLLAHLIVADQRATSGSA